MKHRISLLSTTSVGVTLLWLAAASWAGAAHAFDIDDGQVAAVNSSPSRLMRGRISYKPTPTQSSRKGLVFPRVYEEVEAEPVVPVIFPPIAGAATTVQAASNTIAAPVQANYATLPPSAYSAPEHTRIDYAALAPAATAASYAPVPSAARTTTPAPVQTSTRIFNPLAISPSVDSQAAAPVAAQASSLGAPESLAPVPLAPAAPRVRTVPSAAATAAYAQTLNSLTPQPAPEPEALTHEQLSRKTKSIIGTIPSKLDAPNVEKAEKFDLNRTSAALDALDLKKAGKTDAYEAAGIKISVRRPGLDTNYELNRAYNALTGGNTEAAIQTYKDILSVEPTNQDALFGLASLYHRQGDVAKARPLYAVLLKNYPKHREGINNFLVLVSDESPQEALAELERLEQRNPDFSPIPAQEAVVLERLGYASEAQAKMMRAIELAPENLTYKYNLAVMMDRQRNYPQAIALYRLLLDSSSKGAQIPASADSIQRRLNHLANVVNSGGMPAVGNSRTL